MRFGAQKHYNEERGDDGDHRCELRAYDEVVNVYHDCKYRSIVMAIIRVSIQNNTWYVKWIPGRINGSSISSADAIPVNTAEATRKLARYNRSSRIYTVEYITLLSEKPGS